LLKMGGGEEAAADLARALVSAGTTPSSPFLLVARRRKVEQVRGRRSLGGVGLVVDCRTCRDTGVAVVLESGDNEDRR
jgi:hypothetical protein